MPLNMDETMNFPCVSAGYIGTTVENSTLNAKYYALLFNQIKDNPDFLHPLIILPQRVPRLGFFDELCQLETNYFTKSFSEIISVIQSNYLASLETSQINAQKFINWGNIALRFGLCGFIHESLSKPSNAFSASEIALIKELSKIELMLSNDEPICISGLLELAHQYIDNQDTGHREKIRILISLVVNFYRHQKISNNASEVFSLVNYLLEIVQQFENEDFLNKLYTSIAYRGIAMATEFSNEQKTVFLSKAEHLARTLQCNTALENIIVDDNLYTCFQTMSKWSYLKKDFLKAEYYLTEMIKLDPYDSVGYSELGFFLIKMEQYEPAARNFKKALELGPPGTGMNAYYLAKCVEKQSNNSKSIEYLYKSTELDTEALSPWLDLLEYFLRINQNNKVIEIAKHIFNSPVLYEQLEEHELIKINSFVS